MQFYRIAEITEVILVTIFFFISLANSGRWHDCKPSSNSRKTPLK